jgi:putative transposase
MSGQHADYRRFHLLNIVSNESSFRPGHIIDGSISGARFAHCINQIAQVHGLSGEFVFDNDPEGTSWAMFDWSERPGVCLRPGKSLQNAFAESFNGKLRDECPYLHWFGPLRHA